MDLQAIKSPKSIDIVIPIFNEQDVIRQLHGRVATTIKKLPYACRIIYVDDGSRDQTIPKLLAALGTDENVELIQLSRNFGQAAAIQAGLMAAKADAVAVMDGDLQDPPELIAELVERWTTGYEIVIARRTDRVEESWLRKLGFIAFHKIFKSLSDLTIPENCGTFCLLDRCAVEAITKLPEAHRFFPGLRAWVGFDQGFVDYVRPKRAAGQPKQSLGRLARYAFDGIFSFSRKPAEWLMGLGFAQVFLGLVVLVSLLVLWACNYLNDVSPWVVGACVVTILAGMQLIGLGIVGELVFRVYDQVKQRPSYFVSQSTTLRKTNSLGEGNVSLVTQRRQAG